MGERYDAGLLNDWGGGNVEWWQDYLRAEIERSNDFHIEANESNTRLQAADDMYNALWEAVELSDRTLPPSGRTAECQRVYDLCRAALKKAEGE